MVVISVFFVFSGLSSFIDGQSVSKINKALKQKKIIKQRIINFNDIIYGASITTNYNQAGNAIKRGVYLRFNYRDSSPPKKWLTDVLKLFLNGVEITKKHTPNYFFDRDVSSLASNINVVVKYKPDSNHITTVFTASGTDTPVSMIFPTEGYVYVLQKDLPGTRINSSLKKRKNLKVLWTPTTDNILVWLYHNGSFVKELIPATGNNYVIFNQSLFQPGEYYGIRISQEGTVLTLGGKFKSESRIKTHYLIWCHLRAE